MKVSFIINNIQKWHKEEQFSAGHTMQKPSGFCGNYRNKQVLKM